jgi:hypothetical protein
MTRLTWAAAAMLLISALPAQAAPRTIAFDGHTLAEQRKGTENNDAFVAFARRQDETREMLTIRSLGNRAIKDELKALVADARKHHPDVKLRMFERAGGNDVMVLYLLTPDEGDPSLVLWRLSRSGSELIAATYQLDFPLDDEDAKAKVMNNTAESAFAKLDPAELKQLLPATNRQ